jgi:hypothetical protein
MLFGFFVYLPIELLTYSFTLMMVWNWFAPTFFSVEEISRLGALALRVILTPILLSTSYSPASAQLCAEMPFGIFVNYSFSKIAGPVSTTLGIGYITHRLMQTSIPLFQ